MGFSAWCEKRIRFFAPSDALFKAPGGGTVQEWIDDPHPHPYLAPKITGRHSFVNYFTPSP